MHKLRFISLALAVCCLLGLGVNAVAPEVDSDAVYCFTGEEFSQQEEAVVGVCITDLPDPATGTVLMGSRVLRAGDILTAQQLTKLTFQPLRTQEDTQAVISYLPIYENRVEKEAVMTIGIRGKEDKAPVAQDFSVETYKNLPNEGKLKVSDPEGQTLTFTIVRGPKRGEVEVTADGTFTYTPKKNKVGVDSFTYTATDPAGNVSREATVIVTILKPSQAQQYSDTLGESCRFAAEWMRNTGIFTAEQVSGANVFQPGKTVSRGEFLTMLVSALELDTEDVETSAVENAPAWLRPYLAAALRCGLTVGVEDSDLDEAISGAEAATMIQNALDLPDAVATLAENGIILAEDQPMTRAATAETLYRMTQLAKDVAGMEILQ